MIYIQKDLTTTPYELSGISWELTPSLLEKFRSFNGLSKLVFNEDETQIVDIVKNTELEELIEERKEQKKQTKELEESKKKCCLPSAAKSSSALARMMLPQILPEADEISVLQLSGLFELWVPGKYQSGDLRNVNDQTWECFQDHDNAIYPDIKPDNPSWFTFWRPLHGKSPETARKWVAPQGAHDIYHTGEYMIYTDGVLYKCLSDTNFSPDEYAAAWERQKT